jgi:hypothetical protein
MTKTGPIQRFVVPGTAASIFIVLYGLHALGQEALYRAILSGWGMVPFDFPFVDIHGVLSSLECWRQGVDVYVTNPCDVLSRVFFYSPLLLWVAPLGLGTSDTQAAGLIVDGLFLLSLFALPAPRGLLHSVLMLFGMLSTMTVFAVERANIDLLIFALATLAAVLLLRAPATRIAGFAAIGLAALIKFYPAILLIVSLRERPRLFIAINAVAATALVSLAGFYHAELAEAFASLPKGHYFQDMFGASNLPYGMAALFPVIPPAPFMAALLAATGCSAVWLACRPGLGDAWPRLDRSESMFLVIGCALMTGCFFAGGSIGYRGVFLIFTLPGLLALSRNAKALAIRTLFSVAGFLVIFVMWGEFLRLAILRAAASPWVNLGFWLGRELAWWWIMGVMGGLLLRFALDSEIGRRLGFALLARNPLPRRAP